MNTDNTAICGETLDFGPCAMLGNYDENAVFSSIDEYGRYAFGSQGKIAQWNMARLADCLVPLLITVGAQDLTKKEQEQVALTKVETLIHQYTGKFELAYFTMYAKKLGMSDVTSSNKSLISDLLVIMQTKKLDYTQTFLLLTQSLTDSSKAKELKGVLGDWYSAWLVILENSNIITAQAQSLMSQYNPVVIPRNHHVEAILTRCENAIANDVSGEKDTIKSVINSIVDEFLCVLRTPYQEITATKNYQDTPNDGDRYYQTFCGT
jgi:uncharacterized protein YdiU (UPF0061 family)